MNRTYWKRACSFAAALVLACSSFAGGGMLPAFAIASEPAAETAAIPDETPAAVIITLESEPLLSGGRHADFLCTPEAAAQCDAIRSEQDAVIGALMQQYPVLAVDYRYLTLTNGFSCELPEYLIPFAESLPGVQSVTRSVEIDPLPSAAESLEMGNIPSFINETDCRGEGKVVAVIDTELNLDHPMFAPLAPELQTKLTKDKINAIASTVGFHVQAGSDDVYYSSKIPYAADYLDSNPRAIRNEEPEVYHGSHVAGIAAGNVFQANDGELISGVAPDAQLVFMAIDGNMMSDAVFIAALEDAVKLQADAANISLGNSHEKLEDDNPFYKAVNTAEAAGVTVCIAAGNDSNGMELGFEATPENPDTAEMNMLITEGEKALAVASAEGSGMTEMRTMLHNGRQIPYTGFAPSGVPYQTYLQDVIGSGPFVYEYCGLGTVQDIGSKDLTGKLALIDRGTITFTEKAANAGNAGAIGVICMQNTDETPIIMANDSDVPICMIPKADGEMLLNAANKTVSFSDQIMQVQQEAGVSSFTGWGVHSSLELRPDIMGVGGNVRSASYDGDAAAMSGTSMASPYVAGCAVLMSEYLEKTGCTLTGSAREQRIRNLLMTGAVPFEADGMPVTPRRQGAGLVSMTNALRTKVLLTGESGETKINLRDNLGTFFRFPVTLTNISDEDVHFRNARLVLTTDQSHYDILLGKNVIQQQQLLDCQADLSGLLQIGAGDSRTETVAVTLDRQQADSIRKTFVNGFFIEGYLYLEGAENTVDISIPMLGFSDDFSAIPLFDDSYGGFVSWYASGIPGYESFSDTVIREADTLMQLGRSNNIFSDSIAYAHTKQGQKNRVYISPNDDKMADYAGIRLNPQRDCFIEGGDLFDRSGKLVAEGFRVTEPATRSLGLFSDSAFAYSNIYGSKVQLNDLPDGDYTMQVRAGSTKEMLKKHPQIAEIPVTIDKTAPKLHAERIQRSGRTILRLTAEDKYLDSIMLIANGDGRLLTNQGIRSSGALDMYSVCDLIYASEMGVGYTVDYGSVFRNWYNEISFTAPLVQSFVPVISAEAEYVMQRFIEDNGEGEEWDDKYSITSYFPVQPDENGRFTLEYDVTDLEWYTFTAVDRAFNFTEENYVKETIRPTSVKPGVYRGAYGYYEFTEDQMHYEPLAYNIDPFDCDYKLEIGMLETDLYCEAAESEPFAFSFSFGITGDAETGYTLAYHNDIYSSEKNAFAEQFGIPAMESDTLTLTGMDTLEGFLRLGTREAEMNYVKPLMQEMTGCVYFDKMQYQVEPDAPVVTYTADCCTKRWQIIDRVSITVDLRTGIAVLPDGSSKNLLSDALLSGDTDCSGAVDISDAVLLARFLVSDRGARVTDNGIRNADCNQNGKPDADDLTMILQAIARMITL